MLRLLPVAQEGEEESSRLLIRIRLLTRWSQAKHRHCTVSWLGLNHD